MNNNYLRYSQQGLSLYWRSLAKMRGLNLHSGDIEWVKSNKKGGAERIFSVNLNDNNVNQRLKLLVQLIKQNKAPTGILLSPNSKPNNIADILPNYGFTVDYNTGSVMILNLTDKFNYSRLNSLLIRRVTSTEELKHFASIVNGALFKEQLFSYEQYLDLFNLNNTYFYLAYYNNQPVATCLLIAEQDLVTVEFVSTLKEYRNRGIATAITGFTLNEAKNLGITIAVLRAEKEAINVYKRVGFQEVYKRIVASYGGN